MYGYTQPLNNIKPQVAYHLDISQTLMSTRFLEVFICTLKSNVFACVFYLHKIAVIFAEKQVMDSLEVQCR